MATFDKQKYFFFVMTFLNAHAKYIHLAKDLA